MIKNQSFKGRYSDYKTQSSDVGRNTDLGMFSDLGCNFKWVGASGSIGCSDDDLYGPQVVSLVGAEEYLEINIPLIGIVG